MSLSTPNQPWRNVLCAPSPRRVDASDIESARLSRQRYEDMLKNGDFDSTIGMKKAYIIETCLDLIRMPAAVEFERAACDSAAPPPPPSDEVLEYLCTARYSYFNKVTSAALMEFIAVYEAHFDGTPLLAAHPLHVCYATQERGAVSIPTALLEDRSSQLVEGDYTHSVVVTHNHPNGSAFSEADFAVFARYPAISMLVAVTIPYSYSLYRRDSGTVIPDEKVRQVGQFIRNFTTMRLDMHFEANDNDRQQADEMGRGVWLSCTERGATLWSSITHDAWQNATDASNGLWRYRRFVNDTTAVGSFGTSGNDDLAIILRRYRDTDGPYLQDEPRSIEMDDVLQADNDDDGSSNTTNALDERHTAPYRADYFSPGHDVSKAFPDIYTMSFAQALREYGHGIDSDSEALQIVRNIHDKPDAKIKIYRAVRKGLHDNIADLKKDQKYIRSTRSTPPWADVPVNTKDDYSEYVESQLDSLSTVDGASIQPSIGPRDWVTITRGYAEEHGEGPLQGNYTIITKTVQAKDIFTDGNSIHEWGYDPELISDEEVQATTKPRSRKPSVDGVGDVFKPENDQTVQPKPTSSNEVKPQQAASTVPQQESVQAEPQEVAPMTTEEIVKMDPPEALPLTGELRDFLTNLLAKFNMLIWGGAGSGKSSFVLRLANELAETDTGTVLYFMTEEKVASGRLKARMDLMKAYSNNINFDDVGTFDRLMTLVNTGLYRYVIIDSINMINVEQTKIVELMQTFPEVSWIFIAQATKGKNAYAGIQSLAHAVDTEIATSNDKGVGVAELKKHRDGPLKTHTIFGNKGMRDPAWKKAW
jgi:adenosyl cobinamide kinase/adenosyl cobinamide phosphate guanylyltransferase